MAVTVSNPLNGDLINPITSLGWYPPIGDTLEGDAGAIIRKYSASVYLPGVSNFSDNLGVTPAVNDGSVGYVAGQAVGGEKVTNGTFATSTGWTLNAGAAYWTIGSGSLNLSAPDATAAYADHLAYTDFDTGKSYLVEFDYTYTSGTAFNVYVRGTATAIPTGTVSGRKQVIALAGSSGLTGLRLGSTAACVASIDNISVRELGYIATQSTAGFKPQLVGGARNLLTYSEDFSNAAWSKTRVSLGSATTSPTGISSAKQLVEDSSALSTHTLVVITFPTTSGLSYTLSVYLKAGTRTLVAVYAGTPGQGKIFNLSNGTVFGDIVAPPASSSITSEGNGWYRCSITFTASGAACAPSIYMCDGAGAFSYTGNGTGYVEVFGAQLEQSSTAGPYVPTTSAAASQGSRPRAWLFSAASNQRLLLSGAQFAMSDDHAVITCIKPTSGNKWVFSYSSAGNGGLSISVTTPGYLSAAWVDDAATSSICTDTVSSIGSTIVVSMVKQGNAKQLRKNGVQVGATNNTALGATTFSNYSIGSYTTGGYFDGSIFPLIVLKGAPTVAELLVLERYAAAQGGLSI